MAIETLENQNYKAAVEVKKEEDSEDEDLDQGENPTPKPELQTGQVILKDNQTGISYKKLFAEYLKGAERITVQDPYIRFAHQYRNFVEFCLMLSNNKSPDELVQLELVTWNDEEYQAESKGYLEEIKDDVASLGIELSYRMERHHDRYVAADNGWKITMGRGLDIFERNESRFDISNLDQTKRKCKACEFTYIKI